MLQHIRDMDKRVYNNLNIKQMILANEIARCYKLDVQQQLAKGLTEDERKSLNNFYSWKKDACRNIKGVMGYIDDILNVLFGNLTLTGIDRKMNCKNGTARDCLYSMINLYEDYVTFTWLQHQGKVHFKRSIQSKDTAREIALENSGKRSIKEIPIVDNQVLDLLVSIDRRLEEMNAKRA